MSSGQTSPQREKIQGLGGSRCLNKHYRTFQLVKSNRGISCAMADKVKESLSLPRETVIEDFLEKVAQQQRLKD